MIDLLFPGLAVPRSENVFQIRNGKGKNVIRECLSLRGTASPADDLDHLKVFPAETRLGNLRVCGKVIEDGFSLRTI